jgi:hypothetical protein
MRKAPISYLGLERGYPKIFLEFTEGLPNTLIVPQIGSTYENKTNKCI